MALTNLQLGIIALAISVSYSSGISITQERSETLDSGTPALATAGPAPTAQDVPANPNDMSERRASRVKRVVEPVPDRMVMNFKDDGWRLDRWYNKMSSDHQDRSRSMPVFSSESDLEPVESKPSEPQATLKPDE